MKKIKIYLSVADELEEDALEIGNFIRDLNERYEGSGIYFQLLTSKEPVKEESLKASELFLILFQRELKAENKKEFQVAYQSFQKFSFPRITTYIKKSYEKESKSVLEFLTYLDQELGYYYNEYENIDSVKLNLILQLKNLGLELGTIDTKEDRLYLNESEVLHLSNLPIIANNQNWEKLKKEKIELEEKYYTYLEKIKKDPDDEELFEEYLKIKEKKKKVQTAIDQLEQDILSLQTTFIEITSKGKISKRQAYAQKCLENGNLEEAKEVLSFETLKEDGTQLLKSLKRKKEEIQIVVNEFLQRIEILKLDITNQNRFHEIEESYEQAIQMEKEGGLENKALYSYTNYLYHQKQYKNAITYGEYYLKRQKEKDKNYGYMKNLLALLYSEIGELEKAEKYHLQALSIREHLKDNKYDLAQTYHNLGAFYNDTKNYEKAEEYYLKAIPLAEELNQRKNLQNSLNLAGLYSNLGNLYATMRKFKEAEKMQLKSLAIRKQIQSKNTSSLDLASSYHNLGNLYREMNDYEKAMNNYLEAIPLYQKLYTENDAYAFELAEIYNNLANFYRQFKKYPESEEYHLKSLSIRQKLYQEDKEVYASSLALTYQNLGNLYSDIDKNQKAIEYDLKAISILEELYAKNEKNYAPILATGYNNLGTIYARLEKEKEAEKYFLASFSIREKLYQESDIYAYDFSLTTYNLGNLYKDMGNLQKSKEYYLQSVAIQEKLYRENEEVYASILANTYNNLAILYSNFQEEEKTEMYFQKALSVREKMYPKNIEYYAPILASSYKNLGGFYYNTNCYAKAEKYYLKAISLLKNKNTLASIYTILISIYEKTNELEKKIKIEHALADLEDK